MTFEEFTGTRLPGLLRFAAVLTGNRAIAEDVEGCADAEIAGLLGCRPATVRAYAARALATLRVEMGPQPGNLTSYRGSEV